jgi:ABC-type transport system involved in cytochrome bd biosynthesis fused ATPase/permease subunit
MKSADLRLLLQWSSSRRLILVAISAAITWSALIVVSALLLAKVIVSAIELDPNTPKFIIQLAVIWFLRVSFNPIYEYWCSKTASQIKSEVRKSVTISLPNYQSTSPAYLSALLIKGLNHLDIYLGRFLPQLFISAATPLIIITTIFFLDSLSALICILTLPLIPIFGALIGKYTADSVQKKWQSLGTLSKYFEDSLRGFVTLKIFGRTKSQSERIGAMGDKYTAETMKVLRISFLSALALELAATISVALIAVSIGLRLVDDHITFLASLSILILAPEVYFPLRNAASLFHASADGSQTLAEIRELESQTTVQVEQKKENFAAVSRVSWQDWAIDIPGRTKSYLPANTVNSGELLFIVGESGIGKSTFALNLIGASFDAELRVGADQTLITPALRNSWQAVIGWVPQSPQLAPGSIRKQFKMIDSRITDEQIITFLSNVHLEISDLPDGLDSVVGGVAESASSASGGQIRKVALARSLASNPRVLVCDEPTADLDAISGDIVMAQLRKFAQSGAMVICVTHDLSVIGVTDRTASFGAVTLK